MQNSLDTPVFLNTVTIPTISTSYTVNGGMDAINIEIESVGGTFSIQCEGKVNRNSSKWKLMNMFNLTNLTMSTVVTDNNYAYQIDLNGWDVIRINATAVTGTLTVNGKAIG